MKINLEISDVVTLIIYKETNEQSTKQNTHTPHTPRHTPTHKHPHPTPTHTHTHTHFSYYIKVEKL